MALSLSLSVFTKKAFHRWKTTRGLNRSISAAMPAHPSITIYVTKNNAFCATESPIKLGILHFYEDRISQNGVSISNFLGSSKTEYSFYHKIKCVIEESVHKLKTMETLGKAHKFSRKENRETYDEEHYDS